MSSVWYRVIKAPTVIGWSPSQICKEHAGGRFYKGPSIYDVHTEGVRWMHVDGVRGVQPPCGRPRRKLKLGSTDVILSSSHAKKLNAFFYQNFVFGQTKSGNFSAI